jgi:radical SAM protein with 4Fe4S-binding SPASM domain
MASTKSLDVFLEITKRCNLRCIHCTFPHETAAPFDMEMSTFERLAPLVLPYARSLIMYGGEPMVHRNFFDVLAGIKRYAIPLVGFITNGLLLDEPAAQEIISAGIYRVIISIDGATKQTYESIRRRARFEDVIAGANALNEQKKRSHSRTPRLGINFVMMRRNLAEMSTLVKMAASIDVDIINFTPLNAHPFLGLEDEVVRDEDLAAVCNSSLDSAFKLARRKGIAIFAPPELSSRVPTGAGIVEGFLKHCRSAAEDARARWATLTSRSPASTHRIFDIEPHAESGICCRTPWEILEVQANGDVHTCFCGRRDRVGSLLEQTFDEIWEGEQFQSLRRSLSGQAPLDSTCEKCPDRARNKPSTSVFHAGIFGLDFWGSPQALR